MKSYTIPTTLVEGYQPKMTILSASDTPQLKPVKEVIVSEHYVL